jgi:predicted amidohydrolase
MPLQLVACDSPAGRLGVTVCYDLRFPEVYQALTWQMGAQVLLVPSAFTKVTGEVVCVRSSSKAQQIWAFE